MTSRYTYATTLSWENDLGTVTGELEVEFSYAVSRGAPERGPTYACGGTPADPDEIDDSRVDKIEGKPRPWLHPYMADAEYEDMLVNHLTDRDHERMLIEAAEQAAADYDDAMDYRAEQRRDDAMMERHRHG